MFVDARTLPVLETIECDICIVGAGAAGLSIAAQLIGAGHKLCILESGGFELDAATQALYEGENLGLPYFPLDVCRLRYFGGSTNHWGGFCMPFRAEDFEAQPWLPHSGWPIGLDAMVPYIQRAAKLLELPEAGWDLDHWEEATGKKRLPFDPSKITNEIFLIKGAPMGEVLRPELERAAEVDVYLHANALEIETDEAARHVTGVRARTLAGNEFTVAARLVILAAGGIENPRLLLLSNRVQKEGLANGHDLVGRYFLEHPVFIGGVVQPESPGAPVNFYGRQRFAGQAVYPFPLLAPAAQRAEQITPVAFALLPIADAAYESAGMRSMRRLRGDFLAGKMPDQMMEHVGNVLSDFGTLAGLAYESARYGQLPIERIDVRVAMIPVSNPESRVLLSDETDALGLRRVKLDWRLSELDKRSVRRGLEIMGPEIGRLGIGRFKTLISDDDTTWPEDLEGANHHVGTTRMHDDPRYGVVDRNCKAHGIDNLYVAGSSVFPSGGIGTPTLMIIALALRLADHLRETTK
jgi:choline dehydrogenase-like flavoprotein